jgi:NADH-quinone oxidoreductase subunit K
MTAAPYEAALVVAGVLFVLGLAGLMARRNLIFVLMSLEIMVNAAGLAFIAAGARWGQPDGQAVFFFVLAVAAAEVSVGLALLLQVRRHFKSLDSDAAGTMKG